MIDTNITREEAFNKAKDIAVSIGPVMSGSAAGQTRATVGLLWMAIADHLQREEVIAETNIVKSEITCTCYSIAGDSPSCDVHS